MFGLKTRKIKASELEEKDPNQKEWLIDLRKVEKVYKTDAGDFPALRGVDLQVGTGEFVAVIGKSGSGKSTLINMITGIDRPTGGEVWIGGTPIHTFNEGQMAQWRGRNMGVVFQFFQLLPTLTVIENVMLPMDFCNVYQPRERKDIAMDLLAQVDIAEHAHKLPTAISGGQQQRAAIARALANDPPIIVADEPTGNLDSRTANNIFDLFDRLVNVHDKTLLMVTHDDDQAQRVNRTIILADGEIVNEYLARALPTLSGEQLLKTTRKMRTETYKPGEPIIMEGKIADSFYLITKGTAHVYLKQPEGSDLFVDTLYPGQYFGEIALMRDGVRTATVRAARTNEVEVAVLPKEDFESLMDESAITRDQVLRTAELRTGNQAKARDDANK